MNQLLSKYDREGIIASAESEVTSKQELHSSAEVQTDVILSSVKIMNQDNIHLLSSEQVHAHTGGEVKEHRRGDTHKQRNHPIHEEHSNPDINTLRSDTPAQNEREGNRTQGHIMNEYQNNERTSPESLTDESHHISRSPNEGISLEGIRESANYSRYPYSQGSERISTSSSVHENKSKNSKYKRWTPRMDQYLIKLLSDVVRKQPKDSSPSMTKRDWLYVCGQLRKANPETVYSTYTKFSCQQHLFNVNHNRYKMWVLLLSHCDSNRHKMSDEKRAGTPETEPARSIGSYASSTSAHLDAYSYEWNVEAGRLQILNNETNEIANDEREIKSLIYGRLSLPRLTSFHNANILISDFFLTDNFRYMTVYHNEVLPLLIKLDSRYAEDIGDIYSIIPKFPSAGGLDSIFPETNGNTVERSVSPQHIKKRSKSNTLSIYSDFSGDEEPVDDELIVDPSLKRSRPDEGSRYFQQAHHQHHHQNPSTVHPSHGSTAISNDFGSNLANAAIIAINSTSVSTNKDGIPLYIKDRKWFNKLMVLCESNLLTSHEVLGICIAVRDGRIPTFMLNILDQEYYEGTNEEELLPKDMDSDEDITKRVRSFMLPLIYH